MPQPIKIDLDKSRIRYLNFKIRDIEPEDEVSVSYEIFYDYNYSYKEKRFNALLSVSIAEDRLPFVLDIEYEGLFKLNKSVAREKIKPFAEIDCPALLFSFLRQSIADITLRAGFNPFLLPAMDFVELAKKERLKKTHSANFR